ncbi:MAG: type II secretion system protein GspD [bacterium]
MAAVLLLSGGFIPIAGAQGPRPIIEISADIYEYRLDGEKQLGIFYQYNRTSGSVQNSDIFLPGTENVKEKAIGALDLSGTFAKLSYGTIDYNIKTAIEEGRATVISNQRLVTADGETANITAGESVPITVLSMMGNITKLQTQYRPAGIKLIVTPRIFRDDLIIMNLEIESSEISRITTFDRGDRKRYELPVITKRNIKTVVCVPSSQKLYIGGLYTDSTGDMTRKVPIIGDLPGIGFFLRGFNKKRRLTETIFHITPVIRLPGEGIEIESAVFEELLQPNATQAPIQSQSGEKPSVIRDGEPAQPAPAAVAPATAPMENQPANVTIESATAAPDQPPGAQPASVQGSSGTPDLTPAQTATRAKGTVRPSRGSSINKWRFNN